MMYEDMCYEQENQTWFTIEEGMSGCDVKLSIRNSDEENFPDCICIEEYDAPPITITPGDAIHLYQWLGHHLERLKEARAIVIANGAEIPLDEARRMVNS